MIASPQDEITFLCKHPSCPISHKILFEKYPRGQTQLLFNSIQETKKTSRLQHSLHETDRLRTSHISNDTSHGRVKQGACYRGCLDNSSQRNNTEITTIWNASFLMDKKKSPNKFLINHSNLTIRVNHFTPFVSYFVVSFLNTKGIN